MVVKRHIWHWAVVQCQLQVLFYLIPHVFLVSFPFARGIFSQMDELSINHHQVSFWVWVCVCFWTSAQTSQLIKLFVCCECGNCGKRSVSEKAALHHAVSC